VRSVQRQQSPALMSVVSKNLVPAPPYYIKARLKTATGIFANSTYWMYQSTQGQGGLQPDPSAAYHVYGLWVPAGGPYQFYVDGNLYMTLGDGGDPNAFNEPNNLIAHIEDITASLAPGRAATSRSITFGCIARGVIKGDVIVF
jgi:hypothetical protein